MNSNNIKDKGQKQGCNEKAANKAKPISYRLKCAKTANGLSHFAMYGDVDKKESLI